VLLVDKTTLPRTRAWAVLSCIVLLFIYTGLRQLPGRRPVSPSTDGWSAPVRAVLMVRALGDYTRLMVFPSSLHMERSIFNPLTCRNNSDWRNGIGIEYLSVLGLLTLAALALGSTRNGPGQTTRIFGASWFLASYLPISNIIQLNATVAEHW